MTSSPIIFTRGENWLLGRTRTEALFVVVLLAAAIVSWLPRLKGPIDLRWDGGVYYVLGTSLAEGSGYRLLNEPGEIAAVQYPPLLPAIIAAHQWVLGTNDPVVVGGWLRISNFIIFIIYILTIYLVARSQLPSTYALLTALVCLFGLYTYFLSDSCLPEIPFALATNIFFLSNRKDDKRVYGVYATLFAIAAYALRTAGVALFAAWVGESILKKELKKALLRSTVSAIAIFGWLAYISAVESSDQYKNPAYEYQRADYLFYNVSYTRNIFLLKDPLAPEKGPSTFKDLAVRFLNNLKSMPSLLGQTVSTPGKLWEAEWLKLNELSPFPLGSSWVVHLPLIVLGCLVLGGLAILLAQRQWIIPLYILFSIAAICITPWPEQFNRYLAPVAPFLALSLFTFLLKFKVISRELLPARLRSAGAILAVAVVMTIFIQQSITLYFAKTRWHRSVAYSGRNSEYVAYRLFFYFDEYRAFDTAVDWLIPRAEPGDVVASSMPHWVYLRTGLKSVMPPFESNTLEAQRMLDSVPVKYLIIDEGFLLNTRKYASLVVHAFPDKWQRVYSDSVITDTGEELKDSFQIYQRVSKYSKVSSDK